VVFVVLIDVREELKTILEALVVVLAAARLVEGGTVHFRGQDRGGLLGGEVGVVSRELGFRKYPISLIMSDLLWGDFIIAGGGRHVFEQGKIAALGRRGSLVSCSSDNLAWYRERVCRPRVEEGDLS
jgi:hypothetical protein